MEANENKPKVSGFHCIDQLNLLRYCGIKVNGSKEKPSRFLQHGTIDQCMADIHYNHQTKLIKLTFFVTFTKRFLYSTRSPKDGLLSSTSSSSIFSR